MPYSATLTPTPAAGKGIPFNWFTQLLANDEDMNNRATAAFTSTWTNGTLGNGTLVGRYLKVGKLVYFHLNLTWGTTTSSAGAWTFSLPVTATAGGGGLIFIGGAEVLDSSATQYWNARCRFATTTTFTVWTGDGAASAVLATASPFTWANNDQLHIMGIYEAA